MENRTRRKIGLVISLVQPHGMQLGNGDRCSPDLTAMGSNGRGGSSADHALCFGMPIEIIEGFYGKEYTVHDSQQGVEKVLMYSFCHLMTMAAKVKTKTFYRTCFNSP